VRRYAGVFLVSCVLALLLVPPVLAVPDPTASPTPAPGASPLQHSLQAVVVVTAGWDENQAVVQRFERPALSEPWRSVGDTTPAVLGRKGVAWGLGLNSATGLEGPHKAEGDGRSPAGVFRIPEAFGFAPRQEARRFIHLPYRVLTPTTDCVDDVHSRQYNRMVERHGAVDYTSCEAMRCISVYRWGAWVSHNDDPPHVGQGSCIFLHIWKDSRAGTAGCTAMAEPALKTLLGWLAPQANPVLVQLPVPAYEQVREAWRLPDFRPSFPSR
jgi:L,D-peptidoglycan transpeptidase YkuD (ErfK/YbiS/YcfS/YnhG family)